MLRLLNVGQLRLKLVDDWRDCWRWYSTHALMINMAFLGTWAELPDEMKASLPPGLVMKISAAIMFFGFAGRLLQQGGKS